MYIIVLQYIFMHYKIHLDKDKKLRALLIENDFEFEPKKNIALHLIQSIISQQLSTKVAAILYQRFLDLFTTSSPTPQQIEALPNQVLRSIGLSTAKVNYVKNVAAFCIANKMTDKKLLLKTNEEIIEWLVQIKGVGKWTVEMLLMFALGREDVFSEDDLGIQQAMCKLYNIDNTDKKQMKISMQKIANQWKPYRTYACLHLWKYKDTKPN
jgi:DNA-3-methyladenine glycosylase II